jgi:hypothetical protein
MRSPNVTHGLTWAWSGLENDATPHSGERCTDGPSGLWRRPTARWDHGRCLDGCRHDTVPSPGGGPLVQAGRVARGHRPDRGYRRWSGRLPQGFDPGGELRRARSGRLAGSRSGRCDSLVRGERRARAPEPDRIGEAHGRHGRGAERSVRGPGRFHHAARDAAGGGHHSAGCRSSRGRQLRRDPARGTR